MADWSAPTDTIAPLYIGSHTRHSVGAELTSLAANAVGATTWTANLCVFVPVQIPTPFTVNRVFWVNGSTITGSNAMFGLYTQSGTLLYATASTAMSGTTAPQFVTPSPTFQLDAGSYYMAFACDGTTSRVTVLGTTITAADGRAAGLLEQALASMVLPATMASAVAYTRTFGCPIIGLTRLSS